MNRFPTPLSLLLLFSLLSLQFTTSYILTFTSTHAPPSLSLRRKSSTTLHASSQSRQFQTSRGLSRKLTHCAPTLSDPFTLYVPSLETTPGVQPSIYTHYLRMILAAKRLPYRIVPCARDDIPDWIVDECGGRLPTLRHGTEVYSDVNVIGSYLDFFFEGEYPLNVGGGGIGVGRLGEARVVEAGFSVVFEKYVMALVKAVDVDVEEGGGCSAYDSMKVVELKEECKNLNIDAKGLKATLLARLKTYKRTHVYALQTNEIQQKLATFKEIALRPLENLLQFVSASGSASGRYLTGDRLTLTDCSLSPKLHFMSILLGHFEKKHSKHIADGEGVASCMKGGEFPLLKAYMERMFGDEVFISGCDYDGGEVIEDYVRKGRRDEEDGFETEEMMEEEEEEDEEGIAEVFKKRATSELSSLKRRSRLTEGM